MDARLLEEITITAWPSLQSVYDDGWVLRFADGYTRRANSVNPLYPGSQPLDEKIGRCESFYRSHGLNVVFKISPAVCPPGLDAILDERGYVEDARTSVQMMSLNALDMSGIEPLTLAEGISEDWLAAYCRLNTIDPRRLPTMTRMLASIAPETCYASIVENGEIVAVGLGVADRGYIGVFDIVADTRLRNRGLGRRVVTNLLQWGKTRGAQQAYLQVMLNNAPALHLYNKIGYREIYQYWYRVKAIS
jgi:GNAT superfamily N-acetyltransferase